VLKLVAILRFIRRSTLLLGVGLVGGTVTAAGVVMLVTPGPGVLVIIAGLAILATQFAWAERALEKMKSRARSARDKAAVRRFDRRAAAAASGPDTPPDLASVPGPPPTAADDSGPSAEEELRPVDIDHLEATDHDSHATG
jgi:uncharacterized protein (TIGR02611 family)